MIIAYDTDSNCAELALTAVTSARGMIVRDDLYWRIDSSGDLVEESTQSQPIFKVKPGIYQIHVFHKDHLIFNQKIQLRLNSLIDMTIIVGKMEIGDISDDFHLGLDENFNGINRYRQRQYEREGQIKHGFAAAGLKEAALDANDALVEAEQVMDPAAVGFGSCTGRANQACSGLKSHPLLANQVQFDGATDNSVTPVAEDSADAANELAYRLQLQNQLGASPGMSPSPPGH